MKITRKMLDSICARINIAHGVSDELYLTNYKGVLLTDSKGCLVPNAGTVYLTGANGGWRIERICTGGGSSDFLHATYESKKVVYLAASAYLKGLLEHKQRIH
jgi:hypothetical protein